MTAMALPTPEGKCSARDIVRRFGFDGGRLGNSGEMVLIQKKVYDLKAAFHLPVTWQEEDQGWTPGVAQIAVKNAEAVRLLQLWLDDDPAEQAETLLALKKALNANRRSGRKLFL